MEQLGYKKVNTTSTNKIKYKKTIGQYRDDCVEIKKGLGVVFYTDIMGDITPMYATQEELKAALTIFENFF